MAPIKSISSGLIGSLVSRIGVSTSIFVRPNLDPTKVVESSFRYSSTGGEYRYHIFTQPGRFYVSNSGYIDFFVVAGGGGGGAGNSPASPAGGGGAGGVNQKFNVQCPIGFYDVCTGVGGAAATGVPSNAVDARNGTPSFVSGPVGFTSITAIGGGGGGNGSAPAAPGSQGQPGGCGGGGSSKVGNDAAGGSGTGSGLSLQGYPGGYGGTVIGGSGGGAGYAGKTGNVDTGVSGGDGVAAFNGDIYFPNAYGVAGPSPGRWFAGGGGSVPLTGGGAGGGGAGAPAPGAGSNGQVYTGGGGGAGGGVNHQGGSGGPGIVAIRYKNTTLSF